MRRLIAAALCCLPAAARANDFVDTRLNFTLTDENLLVKPGETNPSVPGLRIGQPAQALGRSLGKTQHQRLAGRGSEPMLGRVTVQVRAIRVSDDQADVVRKYLTWQLVGEGKEQLVAMLPVIFPFLVRSKVGQRRLDFDDQNLPVAAKRNQIGAAAGRQRQLAHHAIAECVEIAGSAARDGERGRRLPSVDRRRRRQEIDAHRQDSGQRESG